jgi:hypothetical protein
MSLLLKDRNRITIGVLATDEMFAASREELLRNLGLSAQIYFRTTSLDRYGAPYLYDRRSGQVITVSQPLARRPLLVRVEKIDPYHHPDFFVIEIDNGSSRMDFSITVSTGHVTYLGNGAPIAATSTLAATPDQRAHALDAAVRIAAEWKSDPSGFAIPEIIAVPVPPQKGRSAVMLVRIESGRNFENARLVVPKGSGAPPVGEFEGKNCPGAMLEIGEVRAEFILPPAPTGSR